MTRGAETIFRSDAPAPQLAARSSHGCRWRRTSSPATPASRCRARPLRRIDMPNPAPAIACHGLLVCTPHRDARKAAAPVQPARCMRPDEVGEVAERFRLHVIEGSLLASQNRSAHGATLQPVPCIRYSRRPRPHRCSPPRSRRRGQLRPMSLSSEPVGFSGWICSSNRGLMRYTVRVPPPGVGSSTMSKSSVACISFFKVRCP